MAFQALAHADGELATARAAGTEGVPMIVSSLATYAMEDIAATGTPIWFQLYMFRDRAISKALVERAEKAGSKALVVTVDAPVQGKRERDMRNQFHLPDGVEMKNLSGTDKSHFSKPISGSGLAGFINSQFAPTLTWSDLEWLKSITRLPIFVKGILRGDDASNAVASGAAGIIVSNHGGRQLDTAISGIDALREVVEAVAGNAVVLMDGGVRRGTDIIKALALGAEAVLLGRPILWGLAVNGEAGVRDVLSIVRNEFDIAMALCGCKTVGDITSDLIAT
jgi:4-hydroxymandelate oxidase